jgi:hypothetical protein
LDVELGRRFRDPNLQLSHEQRLCRYNDGKVEDEIHVLLLCGANQQVTEEREKFIKDLGSLREGNRIISHITSGRPGQAMELLMHSMDSKIEDLWVRYTYRAMKAFKEEKWTHPRHRIQEVEEERPAEDSQEEKDDVMSYI